MTTMTILIYDYYELEERAGKHLKVWKAWHIIIFVLAAIFGVLNYLFLQNTKYMVGDYCVLRGPKIEIETISVICTPHDMNMTSSNETDNSENRTAEAQFTTIVVPENASSEESTTKAVPSGRTRREANFTVENFGNNTGVCTEEREVLDLANTYFASNQDCEFAEYMPILSTMIALVWTMMFVMCPGGGYSRTGLKQPWRILAPALICTLVMVGLMGHSFTETNQGLRDFCSAFQNYTNATTCSSVNPYLERSWNKSWQFGARTEATRAASAGAWVCWAGAAVLVLVRCLAAPDFELVRTGVYLAKDPQQKLTPYLRESRRRGPSASPNKSARSEPTATTELVSGSVEEHSYSSDTTTPEPERDSSV